MSPDLEQLADLAREEATKIAIEVGRKLWRPAEEPFRWIGDHVPRWLDEAAQSTESSAELIALARELYAALAPGRAILVHGDLHHHNILDAGGRYLAIDPKPMLGEPEYDIPAFLWNPIGSELDLDPARTRLAAFAAAGLDESRMRAWCVIRGACLRTDHNEIEVLRALAAD